MDSELVRLRLLAAASDLLTTSAEPGGALRDLAALFVPTLADWTVVDVVTGPDRIARRAVLHRDPAAAPPGRYERDLPRVPARSTSSLVRALRDRELVVVDSFPPPSSADSDLARQQLELFAELGAAQALVVPLVTRGEVIGAFTLVRTRAEPFTPEEIGMIEGVARRTALAVDNSRLYAQQLDTAVAFQRSLLPALPQPDHLSLAARYVPALVGSAMGGDWYDAFIGPDGVTTIVIGDVVGHDEFATARMAELRNLLRGCAWHAPPSPAAVLDRLNDIVRGLDLPAMASVLCGRIDRRPEGHELRWANAGHLPPIVVEPGRRARMLAGSAGVLLGVTDVAHTDTVSDLPPGSKLLLYTDGLVEHRGDLGAGVARLADAATELAGADLETFCDSIIERFAASSDDDVALLAVAFPPRP